VWSIDSLDFGIGQEMTECGLGMVDISNGMMIHILKLFTYVFILAFISIPPLSKSEALDLEYMILTTYTRLFLIVLDIS